jgi:hypothetical protein
MKILETSPGDPNPIYGGPLTVQREQDEEVIWFWRHSREGSWVSGYEIRKRDTGQTISAYKE